MTDLDSVADLVPHSGDVVLLDEIEAAAPKSLSAITTVRADGLFNTTPHSVPSFIAVEYMAQAVAAWAGYHGRLEGRPVQPGLLLGVRDFQASLADMPVGARVRVAVEQVMEMANGLAVFDASVTAEAFEITARLSVLTVESLKELDKLGLPKA